MDLSVYLSIYLSSFSSLKSFKLCYLYRRLVRNRTKKIKRQQTSENQYHSSKMCPNYFNLKNGKCVQTQCLKMCLGLCQFLSTNEKAGNGLIFLSRQHLKPCCSLYRLNTSLNEELSKTVICHAEVEIVCCLSR